MTDDYRPPTPAAGQRWYSNAFSPSDGDGRVEVLGTVQDFHHGLIVVEYLVRAEALGAVHVEEFLQRRTFVR